MAKDSENAQWFKTFPELPLELRRKIRQKALCNPHRHSIIELQLRKNMITSTRLHPVLQANREAQNEATISFRDYGETEGVLHLQPGDTLYFTGTLCKLGQAYFDPLVGN